jgi:hypothetical protein
MKNFGKSQALHAGFAKAKVKSSSQWMLIYKIVLNSRLYNMITSQNFDLVSGWKKRYDSVVAKTYLQNYSTGRLEKRLGRTQRFQLRIKSYKKNSS